MVTDPDSGLPSRRSIRLPGFDYSTPGAYFVNLCTQDRTCLFGQVADDCIVLNDAGSMVATIFGEIGTHYPPARAGEFVVMPNHLHGIIWIDDPGDFGQDGRPRGAAPTPFPPDVGCNDGRPRGAAPTVSLPDIVERFKSFTTHCYMQGVRSYGWEPFSGRLWQRNYFERIIRLREGSYARVCQYIANNPAKWGSDRDNPLVIANTK